MATMKMANEFFPERKAGFGLSKEWPFTIDELGKAFVFGGTPAIRARTPEVADAYFEEFQELVAAEMPEHMQNCRDLEALFVQYEPFAKDMVRRYATIDTLQESRENHNTPVGIGKGPFYISLWIDMRSGERNYHCTYGNPAEFSDEAVRADLKRHNKEYNIYIRNHPSPAICSEELLRYSLFLIDGRYNTLQQEASAIREEMKKIGLFPGLGLGRGSSN